MGWIIFSDTLEPLAILINYTLSDFTGSCEIYWKIKPYILADWKAFHYNLIHKR